MALDRRRLLPQRQKSLREWVLWVSTTHLALPGGKEAHYHGLDVGPCVHIVAVTDGGDTFLVRQSRPNARQNGALEVPITFELPGGFADELDAEGNVDLDASAVAELATEAGLIAGGLKRIGHLFPSPGVSSEIDTIYLAMSVTPLAGALERTEVTEADMKILSGPFGQMYDSMRRSDVLVPAQTLAAFAMAEIHL